MHPARVGPVVGDVEISGFVIVGAVALDRSQLSQLLCFPPSIHFILSAVAWPSGRARRRDSARRQTLAWAGGRGDRCFLNITHGVAISIVTCSLHKKTSHFILLSVKEIIMTSIANVQYTTFSYSYKDQIRLQHYNLFVVGHPESEIRSQAPCRWFNARRSVGPCSLAAGGPLGLGPVWETRK